eukprot:4620764-Karenia_brevis.AAC.1
MAYQAQGARARWDIANDRSQADAGPQQRAWDCITCDFKNAGVTAQCEGCGGIKLYTMCSTL